jgi:hypothetical protein
MRALLPKRHGLFSFAPLARVDHEDRSAAGRLPDACRRTGSGLSLRQNAHWIKGFMAFQLVRRTRTVLLMVSA